MKRFSKNSLSDTDIQLETKVIHFLYPWTETSLVSKCTDNKRIEELYEIVWLEILLYFS